MSKSQRVRASDVDQMLALQRTVAELPAGIGEREARLLEGMSELIGSPFAMIFHVKDFASARLPLKGLATFEHGLGAKQLGILGEYMIQHGADDPLHAPMATDFDTYAPGEVMTQTRRELLSDKAWYSDPHVGELRKAIDCDSCLFSNLKLDSEGSATIIAFHRAWGERDFDDRERKIADLLWSSAARLVSYRPPHVGGHVHDEIRRSYLPVRPLSPRLRQVLGGLLYGRSPSAIASALNLSTHTVRDHIKRLHRRFGTSSLPELSAVCTGRPVT